MTNPRDDIESEAVRQVRNQFGAFFRRMATERMAWHLHRIPGTDQFSIFREDAAFDVPLPIVVRNVHAMTEDRLAVLVTKIIRGA